jgi:arylsulfatase
VTARRPNILLLMADQHRADVLGCAGDPVVRTPHLDALAAEGIRFGNVHCQGPLCMPARASFLTERYVRDHGVSENRWDTPHHLPTFLHPIRDAGYHTACIGKMHLWVHGRGGTGRERVTDARQRAADMVGYGFDEPIETLGKLASARIGSEYGDHLAARGLTGTYRDWIARRHYGGATLPNWTTGCIPLPATDYIDAWHGERVARWIEQYDRDLPWLLWVGFPGPHDPWDAPREYLDRYRGTAIPMPRTLRRPDIPDHGPFRAFLSYWLWTHSDSAGFTDEQVQEVRRHYYAGISVIDDAVARIRRALADTGQADNTWILYTSDHGEMMGEHRMLMKMVFYEQATTVPLIIRPPLGTDPAVVEDLVEQLDIPATVRAIAGAGARDGFEGRPLLDGSGRPAVRPRPVVHSENFGMAMARTDRYKLVYHEDTLTPGQLFDLAEDPAEDTNLVTEAGYADTVAELLATHVVPFTGAGRVTHGPGLFDRVWARDGAGTMG